MKRYSELFGWGDNTFGQLGIGSSSQDSEKIPRVYSFHVVLLALSCGEYHTLCLSSTGHVYAIGSNLDGRLGIDDLSVSHTYAPCLIKSLSKVTKISCGSSHSLALTESGDVYTWGLGKFGNLGTGNFISQSSPLKLRLPEGSFCTQISCGSRHSGMILTDGRSSMLYMVGEGNKGQLGTGRTLGEVFYIKTFDNLLHVACGYDHTAIISKDYTLWLTGSNAEGQLGMKNMNQTNSFMKIPLEGIIQVAASNITVCLNTHGQAFIWGYQISKPMKISDSVSFCDISAGKGFAILTDTSCQMYGWGSNQNGELSISEKLSDNGLQIIRCLCNKGIEKVFSGYNYSIALGRIVDETQRSNDNRLRKSRNLSNKTEYENTPQTQRGLDKHFRFGHQNFREDHRSSERKIGPDRLIQYENTDRESEKLRTLLEREKSKNHRLEKEVDTLKIINNDLKEELEDYKNTIKAQDESIQKYTQEAFDNKNLDYKRTCDIINSEIKNLNEENKSLRNLVPEYERFRQNNKTLTAENNLLTQKVVELEENLKAERLEKGHLQEKINQYEGLMVKIRGENEELAHKNARLENLLKISRSENEDFHKKINKLEDLLQTARGENEVFSQKIKNLEIFVKSFNSFKAEAAMRVQEFCKENEGMKGEMAKLKKANEQLSKEVETQIKSHLKEYREHALDLLNTTVSPRNVSPINKSAVSKTLTPSKTDFLSKIAALQHNRLRLEGKFREMEQDQE
ncbi:hypothetical protein SteCoe_11981 [Stentor coeruleus]|uniref:RCC1-like domain-containing protein n=1 Tax=Stentor coeruleus TaxID=5963 RepID=A0A1R2CBV0_9CILI|nr:hypothetical protein SteCoe_11981 [Stentor coeruleus]